MIRDYIAKWSGDEVRLFDWLKSHGLNSQEIVTIISDFEKAGRDFDTWYDFCNEVLRQAKTNEIEKFIGPKPIEEAKVTPVIKEETSWQLILKLYRRMVTGLTRQRSFR